VIDRERPARGGTDRERPGRSGTDRERPGRSGTDRERPGRSGTGRERPGRTVELDRAVSDLVGFVLVFSLVISVVAIISVGGLNALQTARDAEQVNNAERAFEVLSDNVDDVVRRDAPSRATEISLSENSIRLADPIQVEVRDPNQSDPTFLENRTFQPHPIIYDAGGTELVYVMGAVFRVESDGGGTVLESWSPVLEPERTHIPVVDTASATDGNPSIQGSTVLVHAIANSRRVAVGDESGQFDDVWINITSPRRDLWLRMLDSHPELSCSTAGPQRVECQLGYVPQRLYVVDYRLAIALES